MVVKILVVVVGGGWWLGGVVVVVVVAVVVVVVVVVGVVGGRRWMLAVGFGWVGWCVSGQWLGSGVGGGCWSWVAVGGGS